nr:unnamed protein product [Callosobruchus analis]
MAETSASSDIQEAINDSITHDFLTSNAWNLTPYIQDIKLTLTVSKLQQRKQYRRLIKASNLVISVCGSVEKYFRFLKKQGVYSIKMLRV